MLEANFAKQEDVTYLSVIVVMLSYMYIMDLSTICTVFVCVLF